jgi:glutamyl-tRNA reductase
VVASAELAMVGATFRELGFQRLGELSLADEDLVGLAKALGGAELVCLRTCNRLECYLVLESPVADLRQRLAGFFAARGVEVEAEQLLLHEGPAALRYLLEVTASLHSLVVGETEISGQARRALDTARRLSLAGPRLESLFESAIACSRRVRRETELGQLSVSVASLAMTKARKHFGERGPWAAALIGVGDMTRKVAMALRHVPGALWIVNRTQSKAEALAEACGGRALSLEAFQADPPRDLDLVFSATSSTKPIVGPETLAPSLAERGSEHGPLIVCDLGIPRDTDPALDAVDGLTVITLARMERLAEANRAELQGHVVRARDIVAEEVARALRMERFTALAQTSVRGLLTSRLAHLEPADQEAISRFATGLASRIARNPQ